MYIVVEGEDPGFNIFVNGILTSNSGIVSSGSPLPACITVLSRALLHGRLR